MSNRPRRPCRTIVAAVAAACLAAGCASPYGEKSLFGGYHSERLDATHWRVQYDGNGHTPSEQVWAYWIYRCAEVTRQSGYTYFAMLPATWTPPAAAPAAGAASVAWHGEARDAGSARPAVWRPDGSARFLQTKGGGSGHYTYVPGSGGYNITTWHTNGVVAMLNAPAAADTGLVMDAQSVLDDLAPYVQGHVPHPMDRALVTDHGLRWVGDGGAVLPFMAPPVAPATIPRDPARYTPSPVAPAARSQGLAS